MKIVVYTAIFGGYDKLWSPSVADPEVDYICLVDKKIPCPKPWQMKILDVKHTDPRRQARYCKINSHTMFPDANYTIWHGGNVQLRCKPNVLIDILDNDNVAAIKHSLRDCIYDEARECKLVGRGKPSAIESQMIRYRVCGYPTHRGLHATFLLVRRNSDATSRLNKLWWKEVYNGSVRDQLSFDYVCWRHKFKVATIPGDIFSGKCYGRFEQHGK